MSWYRKQSRAVQVLLVALIVLSLMAVGMVIGESRSVVVHRFLPCSPEGPVGKLTKCPPEDDRDVVALLVPVEDVMRAPWQTPPEERWVVTRYRDDFGWMGLLGASGWKVSDWVEVPEVNK